MLKLLSSPVKKYGGVIFAYFGVDKIVAITILNRIWSIVANLITIIISVKYLSIDEQGFYYAFNSILGIQIIIEMGMTFAITQFCSHEMANLRWTDSMIIEGLDESKKRIQSIARLAFLWFTLGAVIFACLLIPFGKMFFDSVDPGQMQSNYINFSWTVAVVSTSLSLIAVPPIAILQGCNKIGETTKMRIIQSVFGYSVGWIIIFNGGGVLAIAGINICGIIYCAYWVIKNYGVFFKDIFKYTSDTAGISWRNEVWPFQWRMAISAASGFFLFQMFTPMLIKTEGTATAGKMGMSLSIFQGLSAISIAWIASKTPQYGILIATKKRKELNKMFFDGLFQSSCILLLSILCFLIAVFVSKYNFETYTNRILGIKHLLLIGIATLANHIVCAEALYLRSHKDEPFMIISVLSAVTLNSLIYLFSSEYGVDGFLVIYACVTTIIGLGLGSVVFIAKRDFWDRNAIK